MHNDTLTYSSVAIRGPVFLQWSEISIKLAAVPCRVHLSVMEFPHVEQSEARICIFFLQKLAVISNHLQSKVEKLELEASGITNMMKFYMWDPKKYTFQSLPQWVIIFVNTLEKQ